MGRCLSQVPKVGDLTAGLARLCPDGIDVNFENVGGKHPGASLDNMKPFGRVVLCGMISMYNAVQRELGPTDLFLAITRRLTLRGVVVFDYADKREQFLSDMKSGSVREK